MAAAVIAANTNQSVMMTGLHHGRERAATDKSVIGSGPRGLAFTMRRHTVRLGEERRVFLPKDLGAEAHRCVDLRLTEASFVLAAGAQRVEQRPGADIEALLKLSE